MNKEEITELIFILKEKNMIDIVEKDYLIKPEIFDFLYDKYPPNINNCNVLVTKFTEISDPTKNANLSNEQEKMLLLLISNISDTSTEMAILTDYYAQFLLKKSNIKSAIDFFDLAIDTQNKINKNDDLLQNFICHLSEAYLIDKQYDNALKFAFSVLNFYTNKNIKTTSSLYATNIISTAYFRQKNFKSAHKYITTAIETAKELKSDKKILTNLYYDASVCAFNIKKHKEAEKLIKEAENSYNSIPNNQKLKETEQKINLQKEFLKLNSKINLTFFSINKKNLILILVLILIFLIILTMIIL